MKTVVLVMLGSVVAWWQAMPREFEFLLFLPFAIAGIGLAAEAIAAAARHRSGHAGRRMPHHRTAHPDPRSAPRTSSLLVQRAHRRPQGRR